jgi:sterol desaturase/sphingolipid hydroxylase (fatty acid hydroxylase superfamily)
VTPLALVFNALLLVQFHGASAYTSSSIADESILSSFLARMQKNRIDDMEIMDLAFCGCIAILGMEAMNIATKALGSSLRLKNIPVRGKHLDDLESIDLLYITLNKMATVPFVYLLAKYMYHEPNAVSSLDSITFGNLILPIVPFFIIYDFFYTILHWALHIQSVYGYIHKHHHRQKAPSRANADAVNVHPIEFFLGEYNHLFAIFIYCNLLGFKMHILALSIIFTLSPVLTGLNHTRFDSKVQIMGVALYDSKWHDVHHRIPQSNYGQYTNFWDLVFGSFRPYNSNDRVNPDNQLGANGKSLNYGQQKMKAN